MSWAAPNPKPQGGSGLSASFPERGSPEGGRQALGSGGRAHWSWGKASGPFAFPGAKNSRPHGSGPAGPGGRGPGPQRGLMPGGNKHS